ncbi:MAG: helix-turn-helix transcriptional regulator [Gallionella sp.]|nr:helix-turn-helix transcriptional regulator [Gallionella sp.]
MKTELSPRQREILECLSLGLRLKEIAAKLKIAVPTARRHLEAAQARLGSSSTLESVAKFNRHLGEIAMGSKLGIDATRKIPGEGFKRPRPPLTRWMPR